MNVLHKFDMKSNQTLSINLYFQNSLVRPTISRRFIAASPPPLFSPSRISERKKKPFRSHKIWLTHYNVCAYGSVHSSNIKTCISHHSVNVIFITLFWVGVQLFSDVPNDERKVECENITFKLNCDWLFLLLHKYGYHSNLLFVTARNRSVN